MRFLSRSIPDHEWVKSARPILDAALESATALGEAMRKNDIDRQAEAIAEVLRRFPSLRDSLRRCGSPKSADARQSKKSLDLALKDYTDGAKQGDLLFVGLKKGAAERASSGGLAGRAARARIVGQQGMYAGIVKKAEGRLETARAFIEMTAPE